MCIFEYDQEKHLRMEREDGLKEGLEKGKELGSEESRQQIITRMFEKGYSDEQIAEICDISEEEVKKYRETL